MSHSIRISSHPFRTGGSKLRRPDCCRGKGALFCNASSLDYLFWALHIDEAASLPPLRWHEIHLLPAEMLLGFFSWVKLKWNLAVLLLCPLKVSQVLTSSLLTSLRHKNRSLQHLFGRHCSGHRMHLVISVAITSTADTTYQGWRLHP